METATDVSQVTLFFSSHRNKNSLIMNIELSLGQELIRTLCIDSLVPSSRGPHPLEDPLTCFVAIPTLRMKQRRHSPILTSPRPLGWCDDRVNTRVGLAPGTAVRGRAGIRPQMPASMLAMSTALSPPRTQSLPAGDSGLLKRGLWASRGSSALVQPLTPTSALSVVWLREGAVTPQFSCPRWPPQGKRPSLSHHGWGGGLCFLLILSPDPTQALPSFRAMTDTF